MKALMTRPTPQPAGSQSFSQPSATASTTPVRVGAPVVGGPLLCSAVQSVGKEAPGRYLSNFRAFRWMSSTWPSLKLEFALRSEMAMMSLTQTFVNLLSYFGLISLDAKMYEYLR